MICHITTRAAWEAAQASGQFLSPEFDDHGFIHCSTPEQVLMVANAFFRGQSGLVLLIIDPARLKVPVRWEPPHSTGRLPEFTHDSVFPHLRCHQHRCRPADVKCAKRNGYFCSSPTGVVSAIAVV